MNKSVVLVHFFHHLIAISAYALGDPILMFSADIARYQNDIRLTLHIYLDDLLTQSRCHSHRGVFRLQQTVTKLPLPWR